MYVWQRRQFLGAIPALPLLGASLNAESSSSRLRAGAAKANITLPVGGNNGGVILRGARVKQVHDELYTRCLILDDGATSVALVICDLRMIGRDLVDRAKKLAAQALGWPEGNLLVAATHTHAAPGLVGIANGPLDLWHAELVVVRIADAIRRAAANLAPARIGWGSVAKPEHLFNRRYKVAPGTAPANPFGETTDAVVTNPGAKLGILEPAGVVDPALSILSVQHADGRPMAVLANYGLHYVGGYATSSVSADYFGMFAERLQQILDPADRDSTFVGIMSNGASGDVNNSDRRRSGERQPAWMKMKAVADDLAQTAANVCSEINYREDIKLAVAHAELDLAVRQPDEARLRWAQSVVQSIQNRDALTRPEVYAEEAIALAEGPSRVSIPLQAIRIGDLGIAAIPCEVFAETGLEIKQQSALQPTFVIELANGYNGYLPTPQQHAWGGYETWPARSSYLEVDAAPKIRDRMLDLLKQV